MKDMYKGKAFSPITSLTDNIGDGDTVIPVADISAFPPAPNYATIGTDEGAETLKYMALTESSLSGCVRGIEGQAKAWNTDDVIGSYITAANLNSMMENIAETAQAVPQSIAEHSVSAEAHEDIRQAVLEGDSSTLAGAKEYTDESIAAIPVPDVSGQIAEHNMSGAAHGDIRTELSGKADTASPPLTGTPTAPTAAVGTSSTQIATTEFVSTEIGAVRPYSTTAPKMDGAASAGTASTVSRGDHTHPSDSTKVGAAEVTAQVTAHNASTAAHSDIRNVANAALPKAGGTMTGQLTAGGSLAIGTAQVRNIYAGTSDMTAGSSTLATGSLYLVYE